MEERIKFFVGLDVHADSIEVAVAEAGRQPARCVGRIAHDVAKLLKLLKPYGDSQYVHVVYEAGPTGYGLQRALAKRGYRCQVIAPSLVPKRCGRSGEDRSARWPASGGALACGGIACGVGAGPGR